MGFYKYTHLGGNMKEYSAKQIRNIALLGHLGSGKTSLAESILFLGKAIAKKGEVARKTTVSDYTVEEQNRQTSLSTSLIPVEWNGCKIKEVHYSYLHILLRNRQPPRKDSRDRRVMAG